MASRCKEYQEDVRLRVMNIINQNPDITTRTLAQKVGISNGSAHYLVRSLIEKGFVELSDFTIDSKKRKYSYILTSKGISGKSLITTNVLARKRKEFQGLYEEINSLEESIGVSFNNKR